MFIIQWWNVRVKLRNPTFNCFWWLLPKAFDVHWRPNNCINFYLTQKENELQQEIELLEKLAASGDVSVGGLQQKQRFINILNKQIEQNHANIKEQQEEVDKINKNIDDINQKFKKVKIYKKTCEN